MSCRRARDVECRAEAELQRLRASVEAEFREGWVPADVGTPRTLDASAYVQARKIADHGG
jgi:hypothetical protein